MKYPVYTKTINNSNTVNNLFIPVSGVFVASVTTGTTKPSLADLLLESPPGSRSREFILRRTVVFVRR